MTTIRPSWSPRQHPLPAPPSGATSAPGGCVRVNAAWASHVLGVLEVLADPRAWSGTDEAVYDATQQVELLLDQIAQGDCMPGTGLQGVRQTQDGGTLQYTFDGEVWYDFADLTGLEGPAGPQGPQGTPGAMGPVGPTGPQGVQGLRGLTGLTGATGPNIELQFGGEYVSWRVAGTNNVWQALIHKNAITGPKGEAGPAGVSGKQVYLWADEEGINWRYVGDTGRNQLISIAELMGPQGPKGQQGPQGEQGPPGKTIYVMDTWGEDGTQKACNVASYLAEYYLPGVLNQVINNSNSSLSVGSALAALLGVAVGFVAGGPAGAVFGGATGAGIGFMSADNSDASAELTPQFWERVKYALLPRIPETGILDITMLPDMSASVSGITGAPNASALVSEVIAALGLDALVGISQYGSIYEGDCGLQAESWEHTFNFLDDESGFILADLGFGFYSGTWFNGLGWISVNGRLAVAHLAPASLTDLTLHIAGDEHVSFGLEIRSAESCDGCPGVAFHTSGSGTHDVAFEGAAAGILIDLTPTDGDLALTSLTLRGVGPNPYL